MSFVNPCWIIFAVLFLLCIDWSLEYWLVTSMQVLTIVLPCLTSKPLSCESVLQSSLLCEFLEPHKTKVSLSKLANSPRSKLKDQKKYSHLMINYQIKIAVQSRPCLLDRRQNCVFLQTINPIRKASRHYLDF